MTTYNRHQYADPLDQWAADHGEWIEPEPAPPQPICQYHGPYTPLSTGDCSACLDDYHRERDEARRNWWKASDLADKFDAAWDARDIA